MKLLQLIIMVLLLLPACGKPTPQAAGRQVFPPNMAVYNVGFDAVWDSLLKTVEYDYLLPIQIANREKGFFVTELVRDYQDEVQKKYRLTGSLKFEGRGIVVVLYQEIQIRKGDAWVNVDTNYALEHAVLQKTASRLAGLQPTPPKK